MYLEVTCLDEIEELRTHYSRFFCAHYDGWKNSFDRQYDNHSKWYADLERTTYCRVTFKTKEGNLPIESAGFKVDTSCSSICEINNFNHPAGFEERGVALIHSLINRLWDINVIKIYCVVDRKFSSGKAYNLNINEFQFVDTNQNMFFGDIQHKKSKEQVGWSLLVRELNS